MEKGTNRKERSRYSREEEQQWRKDCKE